MPRPLRALRELAVSFAGSDVLVLCYHEVRDRARFRAQMSLLAERYTVLAMETFVAWIRGAAPLPSPAALLTFDGLYRSQIENALPALDALGLPATFFPVSTFLDEEVGVLRALIASGHTIGCHTHTHPDLRTLSAENLEREVQGSKRLLEDFVGREVTAFGYPDGLRSPRVVEAVRRAGFDVAFTVDLGGVRAGADPYQLGRIAILGEPAPGEFARFLAGTRFIAGGLLLGWKIRERGLDRAAT